MKLLLKNTFKKVTKSLGRFLSIMFIIALGISVFMGLHESTASMLYTADDYYDDHNLMDFKITSAYGITKDDVKSLKNLKNAQEVVPSYSLDVIENGESIRVHALEKDMNNVTLINGRMPKSNNECVADYYKYKLNDIIIFENDNLSDVLSVSQCKVVGQVKSVLYVRDEKGISNVGNGKLTSFAFINRDAFISEYYTEVYITSKGSKESSSYYDEYDESIIPLRKELEKLKPIRETIRYEEILKEANNEIIKIKTEVEKEISDSIKELQKAKTDLDKGTEELELNKNKNVKEIEENKIELQNNKLLIINNLKDLGIAEEELDDYIVNISDTLTSLKNNLLLFEEGSNEYISLSNQILEIEGSYNQLIVLQTNLKEINEGLDILDENYNLLIDKITSEEEKIQEGYISYEEGLQEVTDAENEANQKIQDAREDLNEIEKPVWYLLDRTDNSGYINYKEDIVKVDAIAKILPIFFIIVVALMILNTLTRLIEEERTEMGILQSNGFSKTSIIISYLSYVLTSGLIGIIIGLTVGYSVIPQIIYSVFLARYYVPKLITVVSPLPFSLVISITLLMMIIITIIASMKELKNVPATLLRPKPPKTGKKIFIEKFDFIWGKLNFMGKTTVRNLFRYKKRIVMTTLGIAGCTSLLIAAMGINDSINTISELQYNEIIKYDAMYILKKEAKTIPNTLTNLFNDNGIVNPLLINQNAYTFSFDNKTEDVYVITPSDLINFNNYVSLKSTNTNKKISIPKYGVVITNQMADHLNVKIGDNINIRSSDNELFVMYVSDIAYNYVSHYVYMSQEYYKEVFSKDITYNSIVANGSISNNITLSDYEILTINYTEDIIKTFDSFVSGLNKIIIMIVFFACFLAFIVLYNLSIINLSERKREIATFKVLGFFDKEISLYVYRETLVLTIGGIIFGIILGSYLHRYIIGTAETDNIVFLRKIKLLSYALSALITIVFTVIVQSIINKSLKKIDMIDSLKSAE